MHLPPIRPARRSISSRMRACVNLANRCRRCRRYVSTSFRTQANEKSIAQKEMGSSNQHLRAEKGILGQAQIWARPPWNCSMRWQIPARYVSSDGKRWNWYKRSMMHEGFEAGMCFRGLDKMMQSSSTKTSRFSRDGSRTLCLP